jgi:hypothetical protein
VADGVGVGAGAALSRGATSPVAAAVIIAASPVWERTAWEQATTQEAASHQRWTRRRRGGVVFTSR